jgi:hypothetical protein
MFSLLKKHLLRPLVNTARPAFCDHLLDRALLEKWPVKKTHEPFILDLPAPPQGCNANPAAHNAYAMHQRTGFQAQYLVGIPGGVAVGRGFVRLCTGEFLTDSTWRMGYFFGPHGRDFTCARYRRHKLYLKGNYYYLEMLWSGNYGHWFSDEVPRLLAALPHLPPDTRFIVSDPCQEYKIDTLLALGISRDRLLPVKCHFEIHCEKLWFATHLGHSEWASTSPEIFRKMRDALLQAYGNSEGATPERIFVSRSGTQQRRLANEEELLPTIKKFGFTIVHPEKLSLPQQIRTFSQAKVVAGAYGAGMTNILFSPSPALMLELQDAIYAPRMWYWKLAGMLGHGYATLVGAASASRYDVDTDFTLQSDSFKQFIEGNLSSAAENQKNNGE